jgi:hypothetical protein
MSITSAQSYEMQIARREGLTALVHDATLSKLG